MLYRKKDILPTMPITARHRYINHNEEYDIPPNHQQIVAIVCNKGSYLFEAKTPDGCTFLVYLPPRFRKLLWIRRGTYVLVEPMDNGKIKGEIVKVFTQNHIQYLDNKNVWPEEFEVVSYKRPSRPENLYNFINTNRPERASDSHGSDESGTESDSEQEYSMDENFETAEDSDTSN